MSINPKFTLLFFAIFLGLGAMAQQSVYWRNEAVSGNWWDNRNPWWYGSWNNSQERPDLSGTSGNYIGNNLFFGNNVMTSMSINGTNEGTFFKINNLTFESTASESRTLTSTENSGLSFTGSNSNLKNNSTATHIFNTPIGIDGSQLTIDAASGGFTFNNQIYNHNALVFTGSQNILVNGVISNNGTLTKNANSTLTLTANNTYTGVTTVNSGTLEIKNNLASIAITVKSGATLLISDNATLNDIIIESEGTLVINSGKTLTINAGKHLTNNGTVTNNGTIKLLSTTTNGTATILGNIPGNVEVHQALSADRWWYVTSPFVNENTSALGGTTVYYNASSSPSAYVTATSLIPGVGYVVKPTAAVDATFTGTLSNADKSISIYYNGNKSDAFRGYNLIGNPYPSALNWNNVWALAGNQSVIGSTMWYPSTDGSTFPTYNATGSVGVPSDATEFIPPMQGFWVLSSELATSSTPIIYKMLFLKDNMRAHGPATGANPLRAPKASENQLMRLQLSDGSHTDETVLYFNSNAENGYDNYDSRKMMGTGVPQIYTMLNGMPIVINGMNTIPYNTEIALTFKATQAGSYTLHMNEFSNFSTDTRVVLKDKLNNTETDLSAGDYTFTSDATTTATRFTVVFPKSDMPTSLGSNSAGTLQISVIGKGKVQLSGIIPKVSLCPQGKQ